MSFSCSSSPPARTKKSGKRKAQDVDWKTPEPLAPAQEGDAPDDGDKGLQSVGFHLFS